MSLTQRFLLAIGLLAIVTAGAFGVLLRAAWRSAEEQRFEREFQSVVARLTAELDHEVRDLPALMEGLCAHDPTIDSALVDHRTGRLDASARLRLSLKLPELQRALGLDELLLFTETGEVLAAGQDTARVGTRDPALAKLVHEPKARAELLTDATARIASQCTRREGRSAVGLFGERHFSTLLTDVSRSFDLTLSLGRPTADPLRRRADASAEVMQHALTSSQLGGAQIVATRSRAPLREAIAELELTVLGLGLLVLLGALTLGTLMARGLARPIIELAEQARGLEGGEPRPVEARGAREIRELAQAFNQAIADLASLRKRLAATERINARREIARRVAHEIKNPLSPIRGAVETLRRLRARNDPAFDAYFDEATRTVLGEVARISDIVTEFTRFARLPPPEPTPTDLSEATRDVLALHQDTETTIDFESEPLPAVNADRNQFIQVVTNLLQNALDAVSGQVGARIHVRLTRPDAEHAQLVIEDNGPGVPPALLDRLFEPYATGKASGTGLGLPIVERIVHEHAGSIVHERPPTGGARFVVRLPFAGPTLLSRAPDEGPGSARA